METLIRFSSQVEWYELLGVLSFILITSLLIIDVIFNRKINKILEKASKL